MSAYDLNGKVALITGAARGIGFETARQLHLRGASVAVLDLDPGQAREAAERIGPRAIALAADVSDSGAMKAAVAETVERFGGLDIAMANAGIAPPTTTTTRMVSGEEWERVIEINLLGVWHTARAALPQIVERRGQIVLVSSAYAFINGMLNSSYAVAKSGVESLGRALRTELSPLGASATVAYFGWVDTKMVQDALQPPRRGATGGVHAALPAEAYHARGGRRSGRAGDRATLATGVRAELVALRLRLPRPPQPATRSARRQRSPPEAGPARSGVSGKRRRRGDLNRELAARAGRRRTHTRRRWRG